MEYYFYDTLKTDTENIGNLEELKKLPKIKKYLAEYYNCTEEEICIGYYKPKEETRCPYKIILGDIKWIKIYFMMIIITMI